MEKKSHKSIITYQKDNVGGGNIPFLNTHEIAAASVVPFSNFSASKTQNIAALYGKPYRNAAASSHQYPQTQQMQHRHHQHADSSKVINPLVIVGNNVKTIAYTTQSTLESQTAAQGDAEAAAAAHNIVSKSTRTKNEEAILDLRQRIPEIENIFDVHSRIGNGTFSTVLLGTLKKERDLPENARRKFAIKHHIPTSHPDRIMKELQCMAKIGGIHNVVGINCCIRYNESVAFIMPYMQHDRFNEFFNKMDLQEVQYYMKNLLIALRHVHKYNVIHRDVKPSNFLYNRRKRQFLLVDFGLAQQVPTSEGGILMSPTHQISGNIEGKRSREQDEHTSALAGGVNLYGLVNNDVSGAAKRFRCAESPADTQSPHARVANSCIVGGGSNFKMPLKQLNEITTTGKSGTANMGASGAATVGLTNAGSSIYDQPNSRQVKSAVQCGSTNTRTNLKMRSQHTAGVASAQQNACGNVSVMPTAGSTHEGSAATVAASKYNTNRNHNTNNTNSKCYCYGNPQVCNICLIKKEIHASRAGTPGYRPPEVLLKYANQTTSVDVWAAGVILLSILSSVYPFFKAPNDYVALAEMVTIFGDKTIRNTAFVLDRLVTLSQKTKPLDLRKLCVRFRNRAKFSSPALLKKYQNPDGSCEVCKNCDQFYFNCLCSDSNYKTEPLDADDPFPPSAYDLLYKLLEVNPHKRITADEALQHPFFSETPELISGNSSTSQKKKARD